MSSRRKERKSSLETLTGLQEELLQALDGNFTLERGRGRVLSLAGLTLGLLEQDLLPTHVNPYEWGSETRESLIGWGCTENLRDDDSRYNGLNIQVSGTPLLLVGGKRAAYCLFPRMVRFSFIDVPNESSELLTVSTALQPQHPPAYGSLNVSRGYFNSGDGSLGAASNEKPLAKGIPFGPGSAERIGAIAKEFFDSVGAHTVVPS